MHFKNNIKHSNIYIIRIQGEEREKDKNSLEERMTENFPILVKKRHTGPRSTESNTGSAKGETCQDTYQSPKKN